MKKHLTILFAAMLLLPSCGAKYTEEELAPVLEELVTASYDLNVIYFGEGLPIADEREDVQAFYDALGMDEGSLNYHPVSEECGYTSIDQIKEETLAVFTQSYADYLFTMAFNGLSEVFNEDTEEQLTQTVSYARYMESSGYLTVRMDVIDEAIPLNRTYDFNDFEIVRIKDDYVLLDVQSYVNGEKDELVEVKLVMTDDGFRLDSPTY